MKDPITRRLLKDMKEEQKIKQELVDEPDDDQDDSNDKSVVATGPGSLGNLGNLSNLGELGGLGNIMELFGNMTQNRSGTSQGNIMNEFDKFFNQDNVLLQLAKEVGDELKQTEFGTIGEDQDPLIAIMNLFTQDPQKLTNLTTQFGDKFKEKMVEKNITEADLFTATSEIGQQFMTTISKVTGNPDILAGMPDLSMLKDLIMTKFNSYRPEEQEKEARIIGKDVSKHDTGTESTVYADV